MASSARDKPGKAQGIRIDSSLISTGAHTYTYLLEESSLFHLLSLWEKREYKVDINACNVFTIVTGGDIHNELEGLGVNVFDQGTFEEGVMKQLDEEVSRRTAEQQQKFLMKEYYQVKQERKWAHFSKYVCTCIMHKPLSLPLSAVLFNVRWNHCPKKLQPFSLVLSVMLL